MSIAVADNFQYLGTKPLDGRIEYSTISDMVAMPTSSLYNGCIAYVTAEKKNYQYDSTNTVDATLGKWRELQTGATVTVDDEMSDISENPVQNKVITEALADKEDTFRYTTMPTANASNLDKIVQYIGDTDVYTKGFYYKCVSDGEEPPTYSWVESPTFTANSGSGSLEKAITASITVGGVDAGDIFAIGTSYDDMWDTLLNPTLYPTYVAPSATLSYSVNNYYAVGDTIASKSATVAYDAGAININGTKQNNRGGSATLYSISTSGADTEYNDSDASSGSFTVSALTKSTKGTIVITGTVAYAQGAQPKDSKGNDYETPLPAGSVTSSKTINFILPYYYGISNSATISSLSGLTQSVTAKGQKTFSYTTNNQYMVIAYDNAYGNLSSILDSNGFETISGWNSSTLTVDGFVYKVYIAKSPTTDTNASFTFKY